MKLLWFILLAEFCVRLIVKIISVFFEGYKIIIEFFIDAFKKQ